MAGGQGTRFWPCSTPELPKQFLSISGNEPLIKQTFDRLSGFLSTEDIYIIADKKYQDLTFNALPELKKGNYIVEPSPRNTAPCLIMANIVLGSYGIDSNILVVPADHFIPDDDIFHREMEAALKMADEPFIVTSGIKPDSPHTGYGYINFKKDSFLDVDGINFYDVLSFEEKPDAKKAEKYVDAGNYYWNSGMFIYKIKNFRDLMEKYSPEYFQYYLELEKCSDDRTKFNKVYNNIIPDSIDYVLMEKVKEVKMFGAGFGWNDLGSWSSVYDLLPKDSNGNSGDENSIFMDSSGSMVYSDSNSPVSLIGMEDTVVVISENGILVSKRGKLQKVKEIVNVLKSEKKNRDGTGN